MAVESAAGSRIMDASLSGWGRVPIVRCQVARPERHDALCAMTGSRLARGQGRSYGDAALSDRATVVLTERLDRLIAFDEASGVVSMEPGVTLGELIDVFVPRGWFLPVTPGTRFVSAGGALAADVHGKNQHGSGSFGDHVVRFDLLAGRGRTLTCSKESETDAFAATVGGMGLTGIVSRIDLRLMRVPSSFMRVRHRPARNLDALRRLLDDPADDEPYSVAWIDCLARGENLGRGIVMTAHHAAPPELEPALREAPYAAHQSRVLTVPFDAPAWVLNPAGMRAFNSLYHFFQGRKARPFVSHLIPFFYPLDGVGNWNRLYGRRGFLQYQCVVPEGAVPAIACLLDRVSASRAASFLAVLKRFGRGGSGILSFAMPGLTLALDLAYRGNATLELLDALDEIVMRAGGRVYLAKDARLGAQAFRAMYPDYPRWAALKRALDPDGEFVSSLATRLGICD